MADIEISLRFNKKTGKKDILINYESDPDTLPVEHEEEHEALVRRLLETGVLAEGEVGNVVVERQLPGRPSQLPAREELDGGKTEGPVGS